MKKIKIRFKVLADSCSFIKCEHNILELKRYYDALFRVKKLFRFQNDWGLSS